ncbi:hypothetical protein IT774_13250 [Salinimonas marina]|uniref:Tyrosine specific protein phosphatases domain-containing protein n=1 Tax=Salinimonas marina TaxID=2785918 RepID=A0A7S9HCG6_9ALTE|nr:hypothetical protein [Salinimonas marina]QPG05089.1 hypothetical protein IT774_13250 [Salinimonas marina]
MSQSATPCSTPIAAPDWFSTSVGRVAVGPRPGKQDMATMQRAQVSHVGSLQTSAEDSHEVAAITEKAGLQWLWMPIDISVTTRAADVSMLQQYLHATGKLLANGASIYLHCDTDQHRCLLFTYALLHHLRLPSASAYSALHSLQSHGTNSLLRKDLAWAADLGESVRYQF